MKVNNNQESLYFKTIYVKIFKNNSITVIYPILVQNILSLILTSFNTNSGEPL